MWGLSDFAHIITATSVQLMPIQCDCVGVEQVWMFAYTACIANNNLITTSINARTNYIHSHKLVAL